MHLTRITQLHNSIDVYFIYFIILNPISHWLDQLAQDFFDGQYVTKKTLSKNIKKNTIIMQDNPT